MENNIIYLSDYIVKKKEIEDIEKKKENEEKNIEIEYIDDDVELELKSYDDIDKYLTSNKSYQDKINLLKQEREKIEQLKEYLDDSLYLFENSKEYIYSMKSIQSDIKNNMKKELPLSIASIITSLIGAYSFFMGLSNIESLGSLITTILIGIATVISGYYCYSKTTDLYEDYIDNKEYNKEIRDYNKYICKKTTR